jgi:hypothetical protein
MGSHIPGEPLIYERANGVVYARYSNRPDIDRWIIGGDPDAVAKAKGELLSWGEWANLQKLANKNETLKKQLEKTIVLYYTIKDE